METTMSPAHLIPFHNVRDGAKFDAIKADMIANGWIGPALVAWDDHLITGAHRHAAALAINEAAESDWDLPTIDVPVVQIADLAEQDGVDFLALCEEEGCDGVDSGMLVSVLDRCVTQQTRDFYGIDAH